MKFDETNISSVRREIFLKSFGRFEPGQNNFSRLKPEDQYTWNQEQIKFIDTGHVQRASRAFGDELFKQLYRTCLLVREAWEQDLNAVNPAWELVFDGENRTLFVHAINETADAIVAYYRTQAMLEQLRDL